MAEMDGTISKLRFARNRLRHYITTPAISHPKNINVQVVDADDVEDDETQPGHGSSASDTEETHLASSHADRCKGAKSDIP